MHVCQKLVFIVPLLIPVACRDKDKEIEYRYVEVPAPIIDQKPSTSDQTIPVTCKPALQLRCDETQVKIVAKQSEIDGYVATKNLSALYAAQLDLNELMEIRNAYLKGEENIADIQQRYSALRQILAANPDDTGAMNAIVYHKEEVNAVREVFTELGELYIDPSTVAETSTDKSKTVTYSAAESGLPWAGYWYPKRGKELYEGELAPLRKLDKWLKTSKITEWEEANYDIAAAEWEGLCDSWAMASVQTLEPKKSQVIDSIEFSASDLKALAVKYYEGYNPKIFGRRYQGVAATDGMIQDLRPEAFHRIVEDYLGSKKKPLIIDEDPGPEVWSKPMFRMAFNISKDPTIAQALLVKAYPWMIRQRAGVDNVATSIANDLSAPTYEYRLYYDATPAADGRWKIIAGEWIGSSLNFHPDMVFLPQAAENKDQGNPEMKKYNAEIRKLLEKAGMIKP